MPSLWATIGLVFFYILLSQIIRQLVPSVSFYLQTSMLFLVVTITIQSTKPLVEMAIEAVPIDLLPIVKGLLVTTFFYLALDFLASYLDALGETVLSKLIVLLFKLSLIHYWIQLLL
ncbi:hypothetical protein MKY84_08285 [Chryseomicrobium sp. FSL W7-1435]|uniref:hypothetical protein n=1 Tax=Chryseomicrobium sp. FSL W7-1435 TaxID=2921704 RepID=UPI003159C088